MTTALPFLADAEVAALCDGLERPAAQLRYLRGLGLYVERKPNGRPLLMRSELERVLGAGRMMPAAARRPARSPTSARRMPHKALRCREAWSFERASRAPDPARQLSRNP